MLDKAGESGRYRRCDRPRGFVARSEEGIHRTMCPRERFALRQIEDGLIKLMML
jgi:hypothetical protein